MSKPRFDHSGVWTLCRYSCTAFMGVWVDFKIPSMGWSPCVEVKYTPVPQSVSLQVMREETFSQSPAKTRDTRCVYILDKMIKKVDWLSVEGLIVMRSFDHTVQSAWRQNISFVWFISKSFSSEGPDYFKSILVSKHQHMGAGRLIPG